MHTGRSARTRIDGAEPPPADINGNKVLGRYADLAEKICSVCFNKPYK